MNVGNELAPSYRDRSVPLPGTMVQGSVIIMAIMLVIYIITYRSITGVSLLGLISKINYISILSCELQNSFLILL